MSIQVGELLIEMGVNVARLATDMATAKSQVDRAMRDISRSVDAARNVMASLGAGLTAGTLIGVVKQSIDVADAMGKMSQRAGIGVESFSALAYAAKLSDVSSEDMATSFKFLAKSMGDATDKSSEMGKIFTALGVPVKDASGNLRSLDDVMIDFADSVSKLPDGAQKIEVLTKVLGKNGTALTAFFNEGAVGIRRSMGDAQQRGAVMTAELSKQAELFNDNMSRIKSSLEGFVNSTLPPLLDGLAKLQSLLGANAQASIASPKSFFSDRIDQETQKIKELQGEIESINSGTHISSLWGRDTATINEEIAIHKQAIADYQKTIEQIKKTQAEAGVKPAATPNKALLAEALTPTKTEEFKDEFTGQVEAHKEFQKTLADVSAALNDQYAKLTLTEAEYYKYTLSVKGLNSEQIESAAALNDVNEALRVAAENAKNATTEAQRFGDEMADAARTAQVVLAELYPNEADAQRFVEQYKAVVLALGDSPEVDAAVKLLGEKFSQAPQVDELRGIYEDIANGIRESFRGAFRDVLDNGVKSFEDLGSKVVVVFKDTLADMAATALAKPISIAITSGTSAPGAAGAGGFALAGAALVGSLLLGQHEREKAAKEARRAELEAARKAYKALGQSIAADVADIAKNATDSEIKFRQLGQAVIDAGDAAGTAALKDRPAAERALYDAIKERYALEKSALESVAKSLDTISKQAQTLSAGLVQDARGILGLDNFRQSGAILADARAGAGRLFVPSGAAYTNSQADQDRLTADKTDLERFNTLDNRFYIKEREDYVRGIMTEKQSLLSSLVTRGVDLSGGIGAAIARTAQDQAAALARTTQYQKDYTQSLTDFSATATRNIDSLSSLRDEALRWYESQIKIAEGLRAASQSVGGVLESITLGQKSPVDRLSYLLDKFTSISLAGGTGTQAQQAERIANAAQAQSAQSGAILALAKELYGSTGGYTSIEDLIKTTLQQTQAVVDAATPNTLDAQRETVNILSTIDQSLTAVKNDLTAALTEIKRTTIQVGADTIKALQDIAAQIGTTTGGEAATSAIQALADSIGLIPAPVVTVNNTLDSKLITTSVVSQINSRIVNGETVFLPPPPATSAIQYGGQRGGGL